MEAASIVAALRGSGCVFAEEEGRLLVAEAAGDSDLLRVMLDRRVHGEPLEHVLGWAAFCGLRILVEPGVFVPRRRTELLVREAARLAPPRPVVLDLCCGSGALGVALAATLDGAEIYAADVDPTAVRCARRNLPPDRVFEGDLYAALPASLRGRVDVLVANVPYVPTAAIPGMPREARLHEAQVALDGGVDGLNVLRRVAVDASTWLAAGGRLLMETSRRQAETSRAAFGRAGLSAVVVRDDDLDATAIVGTKPRR